MPARRVCWFDWVSGAGIVDDGTRVSTGPRPPVVSLLDVLSPRVDVVNITGGRPAENVEGFHRWRDPAGSSWRVDGHFLRRVDMPILRYRSTVTGHRVELQRAAAWFGDSATYTPEQCRAAFAIVRELVTENFGDGALRIRPAGTGQEIFLRTVPPHGWPCLEPELAELVRATAGQGRIEALPRPMAWASTTYMRELVEYDGRFMYAALCAELPAGPVVHGRGDGGFSLRARGRFLVEWQVPAGWEHVGLLPLKVDDGATWSYPRRPGERGRGWVDAVELWLADRHGWSYRVLEHLVWPEPAKPLDSWARQLVATWEQVRLRALAHGVDDTVASMARGAIRACTLFGLGAFVGRPYRVTHALPLEQITELPAGAGNVTVDGDHVIYELDSDRGGPALEHPEWPATVWARCRVRMLAGPQSTGALHVPLEQVVGIHTDALYLASDPAWPDDGAVGRLRRKAMWPGPHRWPSNDNELVHLLRALRTGEP